MRELALLLNELERQAAWQKRRKEWSWPEKIRLAEAIRNSILELQRSSRGLDHEPMQKSRNAKAPKGKG